MTTKEAFKYGFAKRLAERGVLPSELEKAAQGGGLSSALGFAGPAGVAGVVGSGASALAKGLWKAYLLAPIVAGGLAGYSSAGLTQPEPADFTALKEKERINAYRRATQELQRRQNFG